jgi:uncharacterized membrane protein
MTTVVAAGLAVRVAVTDRPTYLFLAWNLLLAWIPLLCSTTLRALDRRRALPAPLLVAGAAAWLLFVPNAPYLVTDFVHLRPRPPVPVVVDVALLAIAAAAGLLLALRSIVDVRAVLAARFGARAAELVVVATCVLTGVGIYVGRFRRWNSWDVVTRPRARAADLWSVLHDPGEVSLLVAVTAATALALLVTYVATRAISLRRA